MEKLHINYECLGNYAMPKFFKNENLTMVDIGCNAGNFVSKYLNALDKIHYYEINPILFSYLKDKFNDNKHILGFNEGVSNNDNLNVEILKHSSNDAGSVSLNNNEQIIIKEWNEILGFINTVSLETVLKRCNGYINYLKMDCETSEYNILINKDLSNIEFLSIEIHWQLGKERWDELLRHICTYFFDYGNQNTSYDTNIKNKELNFINKKSQNIIS